MNVLYPWDSVQLAAVMDIRLKCEGREDYPPALLYTQMTKTNGLTHNIVVAKV